MKKGFLIVIIALAVLAVATVSFLFIRKRLDKSVEIKSNIDVFCFSHNGMSIEDGYTYTFRLAEGGVVCEACINCGRIEKTFEVDQSVMDKLNKMIKSYNAGKWNGFDKVDKRVLDGEGFTLDIKLQDGTEITAHGSNAYPEGFWEFQRELKELLRGIALDYLDTEVYY